MESPPPITPELLLSHAPSLRALARGLLAEAAADDVLQETWLAALERPPRRLEGLGAWLRSVLRNRARLWRRTEARRAARDRAAARPEATDSGVELVERRAALHRLVGALESLPQPYADALWMRYFDDLPTPDIAARLGVAEATVRSRIHRGLALLRERLERGSGGEPGAWMTALAAATGSGAPASNAGLGGGSVLAPGAKGIGALIMSTNTKIAGVGIVLVAALGLLWRNASGVGEPPTASGELRPDVTAETASIRRVPVRVEDLRPAVVDPPPARTSERNLPAADSTPAPAVAAGGAPDDPPVQEPGVPPDRRRSPAFGANDPPRAKLRRTIAFTASFDLAKGRFRVDGEDLASVLDGQGAVLAYGYEEEIVDELLAYDYEGVVRFRRTHDRLSVLRGLFQESHPELEVDPVTRSPLEDVPLVFDRDPLTREWSVTAPLADPLAVDAELLEGLEADLDLLALEPREGLAVGSSYRIPVEDLVPLLRPGGEARIGMPIWDQTALDGNCFGFFRAPPEAFEKAKGELILVLVGPHEEDPALQVFDLDLDLRSGWKIRRKAGPGEPKNRSRYDPQIEWSAEGRMIWDTTERRVRSLSLDGKTEVRMKFAVDEGEELRKGYVDMEGTSALRFEVKRE